MRFKIVLFNFFSSRCKAIKLNFYRVWFLLKYLKVQIVGNELELINTHFYEFVGEKTQIDQRGFCQSWA